MWNKIKWKIAEFMRGRNGADQFSQAIVWFGLFLYLFYMFTDIRVLNWFSTVALVYGMFRMLSKNMIARSAENREFMKIVQLWKMKWQLRKTHKVFLCKRCRKIVRVPKGKGKIEVTCPSCREKTVSRT